MKRTNYAAGQFGGWWPWWWTIAAFSVGLAVLGALVLPLWIKSEADRWVIAAGLGVAVAALAALWGVELVQRGEPQERDGNEASAALRMTAKSKGHDRVHQAGHDQTINEPNQ